MGIYGPANEETLPRNITGGVKCIRDNGSLFVRTSNICFRTERNVSEIVQKQFLFLGNKNYLRNKCCF